MRSRIKKAGIIAILAVYGFITGFHQPVSHSFLTGEAQIPVQHGAIAAITGFSVNIQDHIIGQQFHHWNYSLQLFQKYHSQHPSATGNTPMPFGKCVISELFLQNHFYEVLYFHLLKGSRLIFPFHNFW